MISPTDSLPTSSSELRQIYLELLKRCLLGMIYEDAPTSAPAIGGYKTELYIAKFREAGRDLPSQAHSMIGLRRMNNLQACIEQVLTDGVPGDLIETGVWRGGATITAACAPTTTGIPTPIKASSSAGS
ncbi:TylF/MycF/NovP-related O-methyltransferase [Candidatus Chloroploca asiatica]|uniref:Macrocin O-methyltransferase n=1 Tax=Candidatus Chloroploca asiatica TaxID=1506545 RepID=A0A2H3L2T2_9CHLR|nr:TylF/MycF/NovP-related O-methyltransferase [Candidatus Chloroploca asiatica]PDV99063.1 hypothetical protein A9Q02_13965 [Candidatus Chloroploca asiatica]